MNIEKRNINMFTIIIIVVLAAILLTAVGGIFIQRQAMPSRDGGIGMGRGINAIQPESAQTGPTGKLVMSTGIILLLVGLGVLVVLLWAGSSLLRRNPS